MSLSYVMLLSNFPFSGIEELKKYIITDVPLSKIINIYIDTSSSPRDSYLKYPFHNGDKKRSPS